MSSPQPPEWMRPAESSLADGARKHVQEIHKKRSSLFSTSASPHKDKGKGKGKGKGKALAPMSSTTTDAEPIIVEFRDKRNHKDDEGKTDQFRWAILYENQRGLTIFSTAYYSSRSLLPNDPPAFTVPDPGESTPSHHHHTPPNVTLATYPLPDPTWRWVSKSWLVDMRGDGDVQHDGFEYNWVFQRNHWRAQVGWLSAGGYVRRRRWVRLMMRPSDARVQAEAAIEERRREDVAEDASPDAPPQDIRVWRGDSGDWDRMRRTLKNLARDGPKLELWADWLSDLIDDETPMSPRSKAWTEDDSGDSTPEPDPAPVTDKTPESRERPSREWILAVLHKHGKDLRNLFIYPDSRAQLRDLLVKAGLAQELTSSAPTPGPYIPSNSSANNSTRDTSDQFLGGDFWSRTSGLDLLASTEDVTRKETDKEEDEHKSP